MTEFYKMISNSTIEILNSSKNIVSYGFILYFADKNEKDTIRPFLVVDSKVVNDFSPLFIKLESINNGEKGTHTISFTRDIAGNFKINNCDFLAIPLAQVLNDLNQKNIQVNLNGLPDSLIPDEKTIGSLNEINQFTWFSFDSALKLKICHQDNNVTLLDNSLNLYFNSNQAVIGAPVFIVNIGAFSSSSGINLGTRVIFAGCFENINGQYAKLFSSVDLARGIKEKFNFD